MSDVFYCSVVSYALAPQPTCRKVHTCRTAEPWCRGRSKGLPSWQDEHGISTVKSTAHTLSFLAEDATVDVSTSGLGLVLAEDAVGPGMR